MSATRGLFSRRRRVFLVRRWAFRWVRVLRLFRVCRADRWVFRWVRVLRLFRVCRADRWVFR
ncbi:hypothetical protein, partial [Mycolicibacterium obuense]|uniref:hypothetical protein n=1 Tax=Mycolicibacterium obuense TaxID=1807 RepID=UPI00105E80B2